MRVPCMKCAYPCRAFDFANYNLCKNAYRGEVTHSDFVSNKEAIAERNDWDSTTDQSLYPMMSPDFFLFLSGKL